MQQLTSKDPAEVVPVVFDFAKLVGSIDSVDSVAIQVYRGTDANASSMIEGSATVSGTKVTQHIKAGIAGNRYIVRCDITRGTSKYALTAILPVEPA